MAIGEKLMTRSEKAVVDLSSTRTSLICIVGRGDRFKVTARCSGNSTATSVRAIRKDLSRWKSRNSLSGEPLKLWIFLQKFHPFVQVSSQRVVRKSSLEVEIVQSPK